MPFESKFTETSFMPEFPQNPLSFPADGACQWEVLINGWKQLPVDSVANGHFVTVVKQQIWKHSYDNRTLFNLLGETMQLLSWLASA